MNNNDLQPDNHRWTMLRGRSPEEVFLHWGAVQICKIQSTSIVVVYMIKMDDGLWRYAHVDKEPGHSVYCGQNTYMAPNGDVAYLLHQLTIARSHLEHLKMQTTAMMADINSLNTRIVASGGVIPA